MTNEERGGKYEVITGLIMYMTKRRRRRRRRRRREEEEEEEEGEEISSYMTFRDCEPFCKEMQHIIRCSLTLAK